MRSKSNRGKNLTRLNFFPPYQAITAIICHDTLKEAAAAINTDGDYLSKFIGHRGLSFPAIKYIYIAAKVAIKKRHGVPLSLNLIQAEITNLNVRHAKAIQSILSTKKISNNLLASDIYFIKLTKAIVAILLTNTIDEAALQVGTPINKFIDVLNQKDSKSTYEDIINFAHRISPSRFTRFIPEVPSLDLPPRTLVKTIASPQSKVTSKDTAPPITSDLEDPALLDSFDIYDEPLNNATDLILDAQTMEALISYSNDSEDTTEDEFDAQAAHIFTDYDTTYLTDFESGNTLFPISTSSSASNISEEEINTDEPPRKKLKKPLASPQFHANLGLFAEKKGPSIEGDYPMLHNNL